MPLQAEQRSDTFERSERIAECVDCGAQLQRVRIGTQNFDRCPWAIDRSWTIDGHHVVSRIYCNWPSGTRRRPD